MFSIDTEKKNASQNESFSANLDEKNARLFNFAAVVPEPIEGKIAPRGDIRANRYAKISKARCGDAY